MRIFLTKKLLLATTAFLFIDVISHAGFVRDDRTEKDCKDYADQKQFYSVGKVIADSVKIGSCVLISPQWILSAAHLFYGNPKPQPYIFIFNNDTVRAEKIILYPHYEFGRNDSSVDLALIKITSVITDIQPAAVYKGGNELGKRISIIGYGAFGTASNPDLDLVNNSRTGGENIIDQIGDSISRFPGHLLLYDFDSPTDSSKNIMGSEKALGLEYVITGGDSGSGCFINENGNWFLAGINVQTRYNLSSKGKFNLYGAIGCAERIAIFKNWIEQTVHD